MSKVINKLLQFRIFLDNINIINNKNHISSLAKIKSSSIKGNVNIEEPATIIKSILNGSINLSKDSYIENTQIYGSFKCRNNIRLFNCLFKGNVSIGKYSSLWGPNIVIKSNDNFKVTIGNFCSIARNVTIQSYNHNYRKTTSYFIGKNFFEETWDNEVISKGNVVIENDVWIGSDCIILGGVTVSNGAVVAANSVVTHSVPEYAIVAGSPAKIIGYRFDDEIIQKLIKIEWWNWSDEKIRQNKLFFQNEININTIDFIC